jgi:amino acid permease
MINTPPTGGSASVASSVFNLANTILGAGMLGLPAAFAACGWVGGSLFLLIFAAPSAFGLHLLSECGDHTGRPGTLYSVAEAAMPGAGLSRVIDAAIAIKCFGVATSYLMVVGDSMPLAMSGFGFEGAWTTNRQLWSFVAALAVTPLAFFESIDALRHTSLIALMCVLFVSVLVLLFALQPSPSFDLCPAGGVVDPADVPSCSPNHEPLTDFVSLLRSMPIFIFAYTVGCSRLLGSCPPQPHLPPSRQPPPCLLPPPPPPPPASFSTHAQCTQ